MMGGSSLSALPPDSFKPSASMDLQRVLVMLEAIGSSVRYGWHLCRWSDLALP